MQIPVHAPGKNITTMVKIVTMIASMGKKIEHKRSMPERISRDTTYHENMPTRAVQININPAKVPNSVILDDLYKNDSFKKAHVSAGILFVAVKYI